ncbi:E3 ubiquitin-protein ligase RNF216-like [Elysia marginata]|uniref:E3 ubiquitin-protein ligase RNF216-like n=1 Tax=Elysia marginata TaxID=1093978 RepID=A0AAV4F700_9GAST|nr:E3 ubiquitin-protein ligase RNF216-like [Elysia marginata]
MSPSYLKTSRMKWDSSLGRPGLSMIIRHFRVAKATTEKKNVNRETLERRGLSRILRHSLVAKPILKESKKTGVAQLQPSLSTIRRSTEDTSSRSLADRRISLRSKKFQETLSANNELCGRLRPEDPVACNSLADNDNKEANIECVCCFGLCEFEMMAQCTEGHLICLECLNNYTKEVAYGVGKVSLVFLFTRNLAITV